MSNGWGQEVQKSGVFSRRLLVPNTLRYQKASDISLQVHCSVPCSVVEKTVNMTILPSGKNMRWPSKDSIHHGKEIIFGFGIFLVLRPWARTSRPTLALAGLGEAQDLKGVNHIALVS